jgi:hypothetical protein
MQAETPASQIADWPSFFEQIRRRPGMWLGEPSVTALQNFIKGIELGEYLYNVPRDRVLSGFSFEDFEGWAERKFNPDRLALNSFSLARRSSDSEEEAFYKWLGGYDRYRAEGSP